MKLPLNYGCLKQEFTKTHKGVDFGYKKGHKNQWIYASDDGDVIYNRHQITGGYVIHIKHDDGYITEYGHLLKNSQKVHEGDHVIKGQKIAKMGHSGIATGNHLHFGVYKGNKINYKDKSKFVNPLRYLNVYDDQDMHDTYKDKIKHTKKASNIPSEPLNIRYKTKTGKVVGEIYNGDEVETYYITSEGWNCCDNLREYVCSNRYLK